MSQATLLGPVLALVLWTFVMLFWGVGKSVATARLKGLQDIPVHGTRVRDLEAHIPASAAWPRQNYEHLVEQPTLFYAVALSLVAIGEPQPFELWLAWGYVALRIIHSVYQATVNIGQVRGMIFVVSTLCLLALSLSATIRLF